MVVKIFTRRKKRAELPTHIKGPSKIKVGFPAGEVDTEIVERAVYNHYGTRRGIPPRPFLLNAIRKNKRKLHSFMKFSAKKIIKDELTLETVIKDLGALSQGYVQREITTLRTPENADSTVKAKGSSNPLIATGTMRRSVTYQVIN